MTKLDAQTGDSLGSTSVFSNGFGETASIVFAEHAAWFAASSRPKLLKIDSQLVTPSDSVDVGLGPSGIAVASGVVWVANSRDGTVSRVDIRSGQPQTIRIGQAPGGIVVASDAVWTSPGEPRS